MDNEQKTWPITLGIIALTIVMLTTVVKLSGKQCNFTRLEMKQSHSDQHIQDIKNIVERRYEQNREEIPSQ